MRNKAIILFFSAAIVTALFQSGQSCTAIRFEDNGSLLVAKNYDWDIGSGLIITNKRDMAKTALTQSNPVSWVSKYGSITFNQYGRELPNGGMNEAGLVIEVLWLRGTEYPSPDKRSAINEMQWIQYQLDKHASVDEVIASDSLIRIVRENSADVHYFVCDSLGNTAVIEFLGGKMVVSTGDNMTVPVITNNTYGQSIAYAGEYADFGGKMAVGERRSDIEVWSREASLERFVHAGVKVHEYESSNGSSNIDYAFSSLELVKSGGKTVWNIVYDIPGKTIYFKSQAGTKVKYVKLGSFDYECHTPLKILDINCQGAGDVSDQFRDYSDEVNYKYVRDAISKTGFLQNTPEELIKLIAYYPSSLRCVK